MKKLLATVVVLAMVLSFAPIAMASSAKVEFTDFKYLDAGESEIPELQTGLVYTQVTANLNGTSPQDVMIIVMLCDKETGKIKATDSQSVTLSGELVSDTLKAGVTVNSLSTEEYKVFLWDGVTLCTPLDNMEPAAPQNVVDSVNKPSEIELTWDAAYDDFDDVASYNVYSDGILVSSGSNDTIFAESDLDKNTEKNYLVEAVDGAGLVSAKTEFNVTTADVTNIKMSSDDPDSLTGVTENGVWLWLPIVRPDFTGSKPGDKGGYGYTEPTEAGGRACRVAPDYLRGSSTLIGRFTCKVDPALINADDERVIIDITFFDEDTEEVNISYTRKDSTATTLKTGSSSFKKTGTGLWKTESFRLVDAGFHYYMDDGTGQGNFRFWQGTPGLKVSNVAVSRRSDYDGDPAGLRVKDVPEIRDVIFYMDQAEATEVDGVNCIEINPSETLEFDVTDTRLNGVGRVNVEIEYLDEGMGEVTLMYKTASGCDYKIVTLTDSGEWKKAVVEIDNAKFAIGNNLPVSTDDLTINTTSEENFRVKSIRIYDAR